MATCSCTVLVQQFEEQGGMGMGIKKAKATEGSSRDFFLQIVRGRERERERDLRYCPVSPELHYCSTPPFSSPYPYSLLSLSLSPYGRIKGFWRRRRHKKPSSHFRSREVQQHEKARERNLSEISLSPLLFGAVYAHMVPKEEGGLICRGAC